MSWLGTQWHAIVSIVGRSPRPSGAGIVASSCFAVALRVKVSNSISTNYSARCTPSTTHHAIGDRAYRMRSVLAADGIVCCGAVQNFFAGRSRESDRAVVPIGSDDVGGG